MTKDEALKLALEALEEAWYHVGTFQPTEKAIDLYDEARAAIKEALAQPEQEPVAWIYKGGKSFDGNKYSDEYELTASKQVALWKDKNAKPLYTTPPQRKPLTDEEIMNIAKVSCIGISPQEDTLNFAKVIEAAHGIKGEA